MKKKMIIIGGGISGIYLSILLKKYLDIDAVVLEANDKPLKKLLATGNGRCNLSNKDLDKAHYDGDIKPWVNDIIHDFDIVEALKDIGLYTKYMGNLLYPYSESAKAVQTLFLNRAEEYGVKIICDEEVLSIKKSKYGYFIHAAHQDYQADYVTIACGTPAGKLSGMKDRRTLFNSLKVDYRPMRPTITQLITTPAYKKLKGVRMKGEFTLNGHTEKGELLFTDYGISGIAVMVLSRYARPGDRILCDFYPEFTDQELYSIIHTLQTMSGPYDGLVHPKLVPILENQKNPVSFLKHLELTVKELRGEEFAQANLGGLMISNFNESFEFIHYPHLYATGEILDITGDCGGYNIHFALASAYSVYKEVSKTIQ